MQSNLHQLKYTHNIMKFKQVKLSEVANLFAGYPFKGNNYSDKGVRVVRGDNVTIGHLRWTIGKDKRWNEPFDQFEYYSLHENDIVIGMDGSRVGMNRAQIKHEDLPLLLAQRVACIRNNSNSIQDYLYYQIFSNNFVRYIKAIHTGTSIPHVSLKQIGDFEIPLPSLSDQRKIAGILSALDSKIENNNKINGNLEAQAQALFKSWFVDFTPFKDQPFVDSELGPIPQGWKVGKYEDIILDTLAGDWGKEKITGNYTHEVACVRGCDFQDMNNGYRGNTPQRYILEKNYSAKRLLPQDLIIEISGGTLTVSTGRACLVSKEMLEKYDNNLVCTNFCKVIRPIDGYSAYCYYSWLHKYNNRVMFGYENGSSGLKNFRFKDFLTKEPLLIPPKADLIKFQHIIKLLQQKKQTNGTESTKLAALRDTLLPKLMSGEIKL